MDSVPPLLITMYDLLPGIKLPSLPLKQGELPPLPPTTTLIPQREEFNIPEIMQHLSMQEVLKMAYVPPIIAEIVFKYVDQLCQYCADNRVGNKKETRALKEAVKEYKYTLYRDIDKRVLNRLLSQVEEFFGLVSWDMTTLYYGVNQALKTQYPELKDYELLTYANMILSLTDYLGHFLVEMGELHLQRTGRRCRTGYDPNISKICKVCNQITKDYRLQYTDNTLLSIKIIGKKINEIDFVISD